MTSNERKILFLVCFSDFGVNTISAKLVIGNHVVDFVLIWAHILFGYHYLVMNGNNMRYGSYGYNCTSSYYFTSTTNAKFFGPQG